MGLGVSTRPFLAPTPVGSVEVDREGARDGTLDTGADEDAWSGGGTAAVVRLVGREVCVSISVAMGESLWKLWRSSGW